MACKLINLDGNMGIVCTPTVVDVSIGVYDCDTCQRRTFHVVTFEEWYGFSGTCLRCGERYHEEGMASRPFRPAWRDKSKETARKLWREHNPKKGLNDAV